MASTNPLLSCDAVSKQFGARPLFTNLTFALYEGDRVGLVGPNGSGKSTLLQILAGRVEADGGNRSLRKGTRVGYVPQDPTFPADQSVEDILLGVLADSHLEDYEQHSRVAIQLGRMGFPDPHQLAGTLSGGWQKRLAIACELVRQPDVLLMDEPTNHLDLEGIVELEEILAGDAAQAYVVVSHDRYLLENVANRMLELDRVYPSGLLAVPGTYSSLLESRDELRRNQLEYQESLANRARREVEWLRRGPKARTTKAKARIDEANRLLSELAEVKARNAVAAAAGIDFGGSDRKTKRLLVARGIGKSWSGRSVLSGVDLLIRPGTRIGVLGANGSGKTTLLSILAGTLEPDAGEIERAPFLKTVLFEQARDTLDKTVTLRRALAPEGDSVIYQDRSIHVASWAQRFLFRTEQLDTPVGRLSGGEQARILIARLMLQPADLLMLDEPTNDLDIATLEVLEESLLEFPGGLVLVTHDRYLLDRVATTIVALDGSGVAQFFADTTQWQEYRQSLALTKRAPARPTSATAGGAATATTPSPAPAKAAKKLSFRDQQEWDAMEATVLAAEEELARCQVAVEDPAVASDALALKARCAAMDAAQHTVDRLYARWAELEAKRT
jgi:ATP-binding cassette subfamily F protein uup